MTFPAGPPEVSPVMLKVLHVHAHFDDFEFVAAGTYELWRRRLGAQFRGRVVVCTDGRSGHQSRTRAETARVRLAEQEASARLGGYEFELLRKPPSGGRGRHGSLSGVWPGILGHRQPEHFVIYSGDHQVRTRRGKQLGTPPLWRDQCMGGY
ncbi:MAG: PIG-L deacetylase family protein, partial [Verrucomicrobiota bacterium]